MEHEGDCRCIASAKSVLFAGVGTGVYGKFGGAAPRLQRSNFASRRESHRVRNDGRNEERSGEPTVKGAFTAQLGRAAVHRKLNDLQKYRSEGVRLGTRLDSLNEMTRDLPLESAISRCLISFRYGIPKNKGVKEAKKQAITGTNTLICAAFQKIGIWFGGV